VGRASRIGTRAARVIRLIRLIRIVKLYKSALINKRKWDKQKEKNWLREKNFKAIIDADKHSKKNLNEIFVNERKAEKSEDHREDEQGLTSAKEKVNSNLSSYQLIYY
jgi:hypothetical protein